MLRFLPGIMAGALALCFIVAIFAFGANKLLYTENTVDKQLVGIVRPEGDKYIDLAVNMVKNIESIDAMCEVKYVNDESLAIDMLRDGELDAIIILPERFVQDIYHGVNTPATVILPDKSELYGKVFKGLADDSIGMLANVQAGMEASYYATEGEDYDLLVEDNMDFNLMFLDIFLSREDVIKEESVSASGSLSLAQYYGVMAVCVVMLLCGMCLAFVIGGEDVCMRESLKRRGAGRIALFVGNNVTVLVFYVILTALLLFGALAAGVELRFDFGAIALAILLVSALVSCVYTLFSPWAGALILFVVTMVSAFVGGAVMPPAFLPEQIMPMVNYSVVQLMFKCLSNVFTKEFVLEGKAIYVVETALIYIVTLFVEKVREVTEA
jgi:hypothetical protein